MDIAQLEHALTERTLTATIHQRNSEYDRWVVWLAPMDDPSLGTWVGEGDTLENAFTDAFAAWDNGGGTEVTDPSLPGIPSPSSSKGSSN